MNDKPVEMLAGAREDRRVTHHSDGRVTVETWTSPVRVKQHDGAWAWIDTTLVEKDGVLQPKVSKAPVQFAAGSGGKPLVRFSPTPGQWITLNPDKPLPQPTVNGNTAVYADVAGPGADLAVTALSIGFRIELVLRERPSNPIEFKLPVQTSGLTSEEGGRLVNSKGFTTAVIQQPSTRDNAKRRTVTAPKAGRVDASVQSDNGRQLLTIKPDSAFLNDPATTYPVAAGPSFLLPVANDVDVADDGQPANPANPLLTAGNIFGTLNRVHLRFDTSAVTQAEFVGSVM